MTPHVIRYTVKPEEVAHNDELLAAIFAELEEVEPPGLTYAVFKLPDGLSYMHLVELADDAGGAVKHLASLKAFHEGVRERCQTSPERTAVTAVGSYRGSPVQGRGQP